MSIFKTPSPQFDPAEAGCLAAAHFALDGKVAPLVSERDQNFRITVDQELVFVLKIANAGEDLAQLELQNAALRHIAEEDPGLGVPRVVCAQNGADILRIDGPDGSQHLLRALSFLPGRPMAEVPKTPRLQANLGAFMGRLDRALQGFNHPAAQRADFLWNLDAAAACRSAVDSIEDPADRAMVERFFARYEDRIRPALRGLRWAVIHQDANDHNVLVSASDPEQVTGLIDFGDMLWGRQINELAVAIAYALLDAGDPLTAARAVLKGYHGCFAVTEAELAVLFDLVAMRLVMSVSISSQRAKAYPENAYLLISQEPAFALLRKLEGLRPDFAHFSFRDACGFAPVPRGEQIERWLEAQRGRFASPLSLDLKTAGKTVVSLAAGAAGMDQFDDPEAHQAFLERRLAEDDAAFAVGLYGENRDCYSGPLFDVAASGAEARSIHLGIDLFVAAGTPLFAPLAGRVIGLADNAGPRNYGPTVFLEHDAGPDGPKFWTLYGHLARETLDALKPGQELAQGEPIGRIGTHQVNGGWAPHLHFQIMTDLLGLSGDFPGAGEPGRMSVWRAISPDPNVILDLPEEVFNRQGAEPEALVEARRRLLGPSLSLSYAKPLKILRGRGAYLFDHRGRAFLDLVNNICHVGHCHPHVVAALTQQAATLNTNTRYLHDNIVTYAERLTASLPDPLSVCYFVCSGSEANELALRLAEAYSGSRNAVVLEAAYHGNTSCLVDLSPYKFDGPGGAGIKPHVKVAAMPDPYRGRIRGHADDVGPNYARYVAEALAAFEQEGRKPGVFIAESLLGCGGQIVLPKGYLAAAYEAVRAAGGLCIADEVQVGFGRVGSHMWGFETQGVVPDIVTLGKPIGNGHPMAAVVTRPEIAQAFANGMEYFNSFGGNPVSAAVGMAVLDVIEREGLQENAKDVGCHLLERLAELKARHSLIGDVRGLGLFLGVELVRDHDSLEPAAEEAAFLVNRMRERGILLSTDGPLENVIKMKPPLVFSRTNADRLVDQFDASLADMAGG